MMQIKLNGLENKIADLSLNRKTVVILLAGLFLFLVKGATCAFLLSDKTLAQSSDPVALIHSYNLSLSIIYGLIFFAFIYWVMAVVKKQILVMKQDLSQAMLDGSLHNYQASQDELGLLAKMICKEAGSMQQTFQAQTNTAKELTEITEHLSICMEIINDSMEEEFGQIELLATAMTEMTSTVQEVANNAESASSSTADASRVAQEGSQFVDATITTINSLSGNIGASADAVNNVELKVEGIGSVVDTIRSISEQTNLLALNAAIEAARAGEAGRGFAVVADEVRNLAKRTQDATVEIQGMIEQLQTSAQDAVGLMGKSVREADVGVEQVTKAGTQLAEIVEKVHHISDMNYQIASSAKEQTTVASDINENLDQVKEVVQGSVTVLKEVTDMADTITKHTQDLNKGAAV